jgi:hypothetical protein
VEPLLLAGLELWKTACATSRFFGFGRWFFARALDGSGLALDFFVKPARGPSAAAQFPRREAFEGLDRLVKALPFRLKLGNHLMQVHERVFSGKAA